ncbi:MBL fold metallo-hydrolase [Desulfosporosinus sp. Sb-LF]|uniref:MBL fold metallo-hydrolase n=1 Tax=Desulfosporosinus sp. Sb-LF TaxID=2560027 RepID=UPI00107EEF2D|nr:MBL fold metallo-hydrolase [Desulfosporosinus sp. Sb-LF]TGE33578.1 MBL fold metallo-hydrolase [Desulfosporosinus sp. Sb-LF]
MNDEMLTELRPNFFFVSGEQGGRFPFSHGLMLDTGCKVLVDTGFGPSRREAVRASGEVDVIINTHFHMDHAYGNQFFPNAKIWAHVSDAPALRSPEQFKAFTGFSGFREFPDFPGGPPGQMVDRELADGELLDFGDVALQVIHTPGHTPGHISLYEPKASILFSGDIDLSPFGPWYGNVRSDLEALTGSIKRLIELNPKVLVTSHTGIVSDNIPERLREYADKLDLRDGQILQHLHAPKTIAELVDMKIIYPRYPEPQGLYRFFEEIMLGKHLQRLMKQGKIFVKPNHKYKAYA